MTQYISKSVVVAEIQRRRKEWWWGNSAEAKFKREECDDILSFLDTIEVIEIGVDFGDPKGDTGTKTLFNDSKVLEISRHGNSRIWENGDLEDFINELSKQFPDVSFAKLSRIAIRAAKWGRNRAKVEIQAQSIAVAHGCPKEPVSEDLEEAARKHPSAIRIVSPQWETEVESAFIAGAQWQKKQTIEKTCKWLEDNIDHYAYNKDFVPNAKERFIKMFRRAEI